MCIAGILSSAYGQGECRAKIGMSTMQIARPAFGRPPFIIGLNPGLNLTLPINRRFSVSGDVNYFYADFKDEEGEMISLVKGHATIHQIEAFTGWTLDLGDSSQNRPGYLAVSAEFGFRNAHQAGIRDYSAFNWGIYEYNLTSNYYFAQVRPTLNIRVTERFFVAVSFRYQYGIMIYEEVSLSLENNRTGGSRGLSVEGSLSPIILGIRFCY
jgi:hypothetical protein